MVGLSSDGNSGSAIPCRRDFSVYLCSNAFHLMDKSQRRPLHHRAPLSSGGVCARLSSSVLSLSTARTAWPFALEGPELAPPKGPLASPVQGSINVVQRDLRETGPPQVVSSGTRSVSCMESRLCSACKMPVEIFGVDEAGAVTPLSVRELLHRLRSLRLLRFRSQPLHQADGDRILPLW